MTIEGTSDAAAPRRLRLGMVGGGRGAFIGAVHRIAARLDDRYELVAGALSADPTRARDSAADLHISADRAYADFSEMAGREASRPDGIDVVSIVTPNHLHAAPAKAFLGHGIHVICDKPLTSTMEDAESLAAAVKKSGLIFGLTHNYTGYPLVRQAREMVAAGELGDIRLVQVEYAQDWLTTRLEATGQKQAEWRTDPARSGAAGCVGDIGTHAFNLAEFVSGLKVERLAADLSIFVPGRALDDNAHMLLRFSGGAKGMLWSSQVAPGNENGLRLRVYGTKSGLEWGQENHTGNRRGSSAGPALAPPPSRRTPRVFRPAIPKAISKGLPSSTATSPTRFPRAFPEPRPIQKACSCRASRTGCGG
jgi:predicted dehydrogenase